MLPLLAMGLWIFTSASTLCPTLQMASGAAGEGVWRLHGWLWHTGRGAGQGVWCVGGCGTPIEVQVGVCGAWVAVAHQ